MNSLDSPQIKKDTLMMITNPQMQKEPQGESVFALMKDLEERINQLAFEEPQECTKCLEKFDPNLPNLILENKQSLANQNLLAAKTQQLSLLE